MSLSYTLKFQKSGQNGRHYIHVEYRKCLLKMKNTQIHKAESQVAYMKRNPHQDTKSKLRTKVVFRTCGLFLIISNSKCQEETIVKIVFYRQGNQEQMGN